HYIGVFGKNAAEDNFISPFVGSWISTFTIAPFAIYLTLLVSTDRVIRFSLFDKATEIFNKIKLRR
ncbi:MAG: permease, partial [Flavobacteriaceae bacterium]|nr:permease [Flavobacteriaceae bacterium]